MTLTVDTDTYITQADAITYIEEHYVSTDVKRIAWEALSSNDKDIYLRKGAQTIDRNPLVGVKATSTQTMEFPRAIYTDNAYYSEIVNTNLFYGKHWYVQTETPNEVKYAQVEIAIDITDGISDRIALQREGVKSFSLGKLSESYGSGKMNTIPYEAKELLAPYLLGGARIG